MINVEKARVLLENSKIQKTYTPTLMAVVITLKDKFVGMDAGQVCNMLGVAESYKHTVRALLQVPSIMDEISTNC